MIIILLVSFIFLLFPFLVKKKKIPVTGGASKSSSLTVDKGDSLANPSFFFSFNFVPLPSGMITSSKESAGGSVGGAVGGGTVMRFFCKSQASPVHPSSQKHLSLGEHTCNDTFNGYRFLSVWETVATTILFMWFICSRLTKRFSNFLSHLKKKNWLDILIKQSVYDWKTDTMNEWIDY